MFRRRAAHELHRQIMRDALAVLTAMNDGRPDIARAVLMADDMTDDRRIGVSVVLATWLIMEWESVDGGKAIPTFLTRRGLRLA